LTGQEPYGLFTSHSKKLITAFQVLARSGGFAPNNRW
jgi:hypothetical protein